MAGPGPICSRCHDDKWKLSARQWCDTCEGPALDALRGELNAASFLAGWDRPHARASIARAIDLAALMDGHEHSGSGGGRCECGAEVCSLPSCDGRCIHPRGWIGPSELDQMRQPVPPIYRKDFGR